MFQNETGSLKLLLKLNFLVLMITIFWGATSINAQSSGHLQGRITDAGSGDPLPGANVYLEGTAIGTATDVEGDYFIKSLNPGKQNIVVSYVGYQKQIVEVVIVSNKTTVLDVSLKWGDKSSVGVVVVTGQLEGQAQAINQQISSDQIVNVVSEQKIKELPDANAAESVGRLPGVAVQRDGGEASKLLIRGLDAKFTNVTLNGIQIPASNSENRDVDLSLISQSTLSGIELYKALTPDQDADAIAGVVNLVTGQAKSGQKINLNVFGIYSGLVKSANQFKISGQYSNRYFDDIFGVQVGFNVEKRDRSRDLFNNSWNVPANGDYRISSLLVQFDDETRKRYGGNINLDINTNDGGNIKFINLYSKTTRNQFISNRDYTSGGSVTYQARAIDREIYTLNNSLIGENHLGGLKINWALSHAYTDNEKPFDHFMRFYENASTTSGMRLITDPKVLKQPGENLIPYAYNAFNKATLDRTYFRKESNDERNYDIKTDLEYPIVLSDNFAGLIKAGYKYRAKTRHRDSKEQMTLYWLRDTYDYYLNDDGEIVNKDWANSLWPNRYKGLLTDFLSESPYPTRKINGRYLLNPLFDENKVRGWYDFSKNGINSRGNSHEYFDNLISVRDKYKVQEDVQGTYAMFKINGGRIVTLIAGMRYEAESNDYSANYAPRIVGEFEAQSGIISDTTSHFIKEFWLPNAHLKIKPFEWLDIRLAVSKSISRPDYSMRLPILYVNNQDQEILSGNPKLEPAVSWNYDASIALYTSQYGLLTISGFQKKIDNIFYWLNDIKIMSNAQAKDLGLPVDAYGPFNQYLLDMPVNTDGTEVWGFEVDLQTHMSFLPGVLKNIVVSANYSRIWSKTTYPRFKLVQTPGFPPKPPTPLFYDTERELSGQTDYTGNASVGYDYMGFSIRVSAYFQGPYLAYISNLENQDQYQKAFSRWDLALKQSFTDNITAFVNVNNFTNVIEGSYLSFKNLDNGGYLYGISADLGIQLSF